MSTEKLSELRTFLDRLTYLRKSMNKAEFCRFVGISTPLFSQWEGGATPSYNKARLVAEKCGVTVEWLLTGRESRQGPISREVPPEVPTTWETSKTATDHRIEKLEAFQKDVIAWQQKLSNDLFEKEKEHQLLIATKDAEIKRLTAIIDKLVSK